MNNDRNQLTATVTMSAMEYVDMVNYIRQLENQVQQQREMIEASAPQVPQSAPDKIIKTRPTEEAPK